MDLDQDRLRRVLALDEGRRASPYKDTKGNWTIGIGHLMSVPVAPDAYELATGTAVTVPTEIPTTIESITEAGIDAIFDDDISAAYDTMYDWLMRGRHCKPVLLGADQLPSP